MVNIHFFQLYITLNVISNNIKISLQQKINKTMISNVLLIWHYYRVHFLKVYLSVLRNMKVFSMYT